LAERLLDLYFVPDSTFYEGPVGVPEKTYIHVKRAVTRDLVLSHLRGEVSIGAPSAHEGMARWVGADIDTPDLEGVRKARTMLDSMGLPCYASFSGRAQRCHLSAFFEQPVPLPIAQSVSAQFRQVLRAVGLDYDKISPSPTGKGGDCMKLPLGVHPETGNGCTFLDNDLEPVEDVLSFLTNVRTIPASQPLGASPLPGIRGEADPETGEILHAEFPQVISTKPCINRLWMEGIQAPNTRHSATCVIVNSLLRTGRVPRQDREQAFMDWVYRTYPRAQDTEYVKITSDLQYAITEAERMMNDYQRRGTHAELCENPVFKAAMRSACHDEFECKVSQNHGHVNFELLLIMGIFNATNAKPRGIGKSAMAVYLAVGLVARDFASFEWNGLPAFSLSTQQLVCLADSTKPTVIAHRKKLLEVGLLLKVPTSDIPPEVLDDTPYFASFYALPELNMDTVKSILTRLRGG
jgi:hypothetical protein